MMEQLLVRFRWGELPQGDLQQVVLLVAVNLEGIFAAGSKCRCYGLGIIVRISRSFDPHFHLVLTRWNPY
jgi:hypothetical protein